MKNNDIKNPIEVINELIDKLSLNEQMAVAMVVLRLYESKLK